MPSLILRHLCYRCHHCLFFAFSLSLLNAAACLSLFLTPTTARTRTRYLVHIAKTCKDFSKLDHGVWREVSLTLPEVQAALPAAAAGKGVPDAGRRV